MKDHHSRRGLLRMVSRRLACWTTSRPKTPTVTGTLIEKLGLRKQGLRMAARILHKLFLHDFT